MYNWSKTLVLYFFRKKTKGAESAMGRKFFRIYFVESNADDTESAVRV